MSKATNAAKSRQYAEFMQRNGITRTTGACPWGCGAQIKNGGSPLMNHLRTCVGKRKR